RAFPSATIVSLEPSRENFAVLERNVASFPNIVPLNAALGSREGSAPFYDHGEGQWSFSLVERNGSGTLHDVEVVTVPQILQCFSRTNVDILKIDIEGAEKELLDGDPSWVTSVRVIAAELHDWIVDGCESTFRSATRHRAEPQISGEL